MGAAHDALDDATKARCEGLVSPIHHSKDHLIAEGIGDSVKERARQHRCAKVAHVECEDLVKRRHLVATEAQMHPFLHWPADLAP